MCISLTWITIKIICSFTSKDAFVGYQNDTPASVVFQATEQLQHYCDDVDSEEWKEKVLECSKNILLEMASPDALIRLKNTSLADELKRLNHTYFIEQNHGSIVQFLSNQFSNDHSENGLLIQVS